MIESKQIKETKKRELADKSTLIDYSVSCFIWADNIVYRKEPTFNLSSKTIALNSEHCINSVHLLLKQCYKIAEYLQIIEQNLYFLQLIYHVS